MIKKLAIVIVIIIGLFIAYNLLNQIFAALKSEERLSSAAEILYRLEGENKKLKQRLDKISSNEFIEEQARNKLNLSKLGETMVIIPDEKLNQVLGASGSAQKQEERLPNPLGWLRLFWH